MKKAKLLISLVLGVVMILSQVFVVTAAQPYDDMEIISGTVHSITLETNPSTGVITLLVVLVYGENSSQSVRISQETAYDLGLVSWDEDGNPVINEDTLGQVIDIDPASMIPDEEPARHPVGNALATFFSDIEDVDYSAIMKAHEEGHGFGVIAQALWLTRKLGGEEADLELYTAILQAKQDGDFSDFVLEDGTSILNWGQFKKAVLDGDKKINLGSVMSAQNDDGDHGNAGGNGNGNHSNNGNNKNKEKDKEKDNNRNGNNNGNGNNNRP